MFVEDDADGYPTATSVSGFGSSYVWAVPGVRIDDMAVNSGLHIETLARPVKNADPAKQRVLWYWDPTTETIQDVPSENHFLIYKVGLAAQGIFLSGTTESAPAALKIAAPLLSDMGFDSYGGLVRFALHRQVPPPAGTYGIFARFKSDQYQPSDPFLVVFNNGQLSGTQMMSGALAINAAAVDAGSLPGDFNGNGTVDAADYIVWRNGLGTASEYDVWKSHFGQTAGSAGTIEIGSAAIPEPYSLSLVVSGLWVIICRRRASKL